jgi:hypothetical protein
MINILKADEKGEGMWEEVRMVESEDEQKYKEMDKNKLKQ